MCLSITSYYFYHAFITTDHINNYEKYKLIISPTTDCLNMEQIVEVSNSMENGDYVIPVLLATNFVFFLRRCSRIQNIWKRSLPALL